LKKKEQAKESARIPATPKGRIKGTVNVGEREKTKLSNWREMCMKWQECCEEGKKRLKMTKVR
jgi:hypothetical protein